MKSGRDLRVEPRSDTRLLGFLVGSVNFDVDSRHLLVSLMVAKREREREI